MSGQLRVGDAEAPADDADGDAVARQSALVEPVGADTPNPGGDPAGVGVLGA